jgi:hypothetical protein
MRFSLRPAVVAFSLFLAALVAVPAGATPAAACTWTPSALPLPTEFATGSVYAAGPNGYLAGTAYTATWAEGMVVWHDGAIVGSQVWPDGVDVRVSGVNGSGDVSGYLYWPDTGAWSGFRFRDGVLDLLPSPAAARTTTSDINESGDIVGYIGYTGSADTGGVLWPASAPGTYRILAEDGLVGIDDSGRVVTESGVIRSPDGSTVRLAGANDLAFERFGHGRIIGHAPRSSSALTEWDMTGARIRSTTGNTAVGVNGNGLLAAWYFKNGGSNTLGVWRDGTFLGDVGTVLNVYDVTDNDELVGSWGTGGARWQPTTWSCLP